jgi:hypothetical protein
MGKQKVNELVLERSLSTQLDNNCEATRALCLD